MSTFLYSETNERIVKRLIELQKERGIKVLFATEAGSRAWRFHSPDSDFDIRFIYSRPIKEYLSIFPGRDTIELIEEPFDFVGWDIRKAMRLLLKSNPPLLEWISLGPGYFKQGPLSDLLTQAKDKVISPHSCFYHYYHMAEGNYREYLRGERVRTKKYFYVLRPVLSCRWLEKHNTFPPLDFMDLFSDLRSDAPEKVSRELLVEIINLLGKKTRGEELGEGPRIPIINDFIDAELIRMKSLPDILKDNEETKQEIAEQVNNILFTCLFEESQLALIEIAKAQKVLNNIFN